jgi:syntaxin 1B/2/3
MQPSSSGDANSLAILEECQKVDCKLDQLDHQLNNLKRVFAHVLARPGTTSDEVNRLNLQIIESYSALARRVKNIRSRSESASRRNASHVRKVNDRLNGTFQRYQMLQSEFRRDSEAAAERQYRIVCPEATDAEIKEAVADPDTPIFQQAVCVLCLCPPNCQAAANPWPSSIVLTAAAKPSLPFAM